MQKNKNSKLDKIKQTARIYGPAALIFVATATATVLAGRAIVKNAPTFDLDSPFEPLPEVTGDEKKALFDREDGVLQKIEDDIYFYSFPETANTEA
jgi:hypothetical protein